MNRRGIASAIAALVLVVGCAQQPPAPTASQASSVASTPSQAPAATAAPPEPASNPPSPSPTLSPTPTPVPTPAPRDAIAAPHPKVAFAKVSTAIQAALKAAPDALNPGLVAAMPRLLRDCQKGGEFGDDRPYRCLFLAVGAYHAYIDTGDDSWFGAALRAVNYIWNTPYQGGVMMDQPTWQSFITGAFAVPYPRPTSAVPVRQSLVDAPHPAVTYAALTSAARAASAAVPGLADEVSLCGRLKPNRSNIDDVAQACVHAASDAYRAYLKTGDAATWRAATTAASYVYNHSLLPPMVIGNNGTYENTVDLVSGFDDLLTSNSPASIFAGQAP